MTNIVSKVDQTDVEKYAKRLKGKRAKFLMAKTKGIIVSTKPGQQRLKEALKTGYSVFVCNEVDEKEFENFKVDYWINTACNRIEGKNIINLEDLPK